VPRNTNAGNAQVAVTRSATSGLTGSDYELEFNGAAWSMKRLDTGAPVALAGTGTALDPLRADGLSMVVSGTPASGDRVLVRPTREAIAGFDLLVSDPSRVAAAAPIIASASAANTGNATITRGEVLDPANAQLRSTVTLQFTSATTYSINGAGSFTYASGQPIDVNGWRVAISGAPATGDSFSVVDGSTATGDNRNVLAMADAMAAPRLDGGTTSIPAGLGRLTSEIGVSTQQAQVNRDAQQVLQDEAVAQRQNYSGVNLDEEAANLLRYQQAYQAAAQLIRVANEMFQALLDASR
jgi:flagellar hook-associated protein 1 FlgK